MKLDLYKCTHDDNYLLIPPWGFLYLSMQGITHESYIAALQTFLYEIRLGEIIHVYVFFNMWLNYCCESWTRKSENWRTAKWLYSRKLKKNKTNHPISSNSHPSATGNKAIHILKIGEGVVVKVQSWPESAVLSNLLALLSRYFR